MDFLSVLTRSPDGGALHAFLGGGRQAEDGPRPLVRTLRHAEVPLRVPLPRQLVVQPPGLNFGGLSPFISFYNYWRWSRVEGEAEAADPATMLVKKHTGKGGGREPGPADASPAGQRCAAAGPQCAALAALLSVVAILSCLYLGVKTNDLQARIAALESAKGAPSIPLLSDTEDQLKAMVQEKVERLLAQKSYEHMAKIRIAREAPSECNCPAGKMELI